MVLLATAVAKEEGEEEEEEMTQNQIDDSPNFPPTLLNFRQI